jgi:hypothetical protein
VKWEISVARWHPHLHGLATAIHETSELESKSIVALVYEKKHLIMTAFFLFIYSSLYTSVFSLIRIMEEIEQKQEMLRHTLLSYTKSLL